MASVQPTKESISRTHHLKIDFKYKQSSCKPGNYINKYKEYIKGGSHIKLTVHRTSMSLNRSQRGLKTRPLIWN